MKLYQLKVKICSLDNIGYNKQELNYNIPQEAIINLKEKTITNQELGKMSFTQIQARSTFSGVNYWYLTDCPLLKTRAIITNSSGNVKIRIYKFLSSKLFIKIFNFFFKNI